MNRAGAFIRIAASVVLAVLIAACGEAPTARPEDIAAYGRRSPVTLSPAPRSSLANALNKEKFVVAANKICRDLIGDAIDGDPPTSMRELLALLDRAVAADAETTRRIRALGGFANDARVKEMLKLNDQLHVYLVRARDAAGRGDLQGALVAVGDGQGISDQVDAIASDLGLVDCVDG